MKCRLCQGKVKKFLDLGKTALPEEFRLQKDLGKPINKYPLNLVYCLNCNHVQLGFVPPIDIIYKKNYFYDYSLTKSGRTHWHKLSKKIYKDYKPDKNDLVVDIGSNTGTLLSQFRLLGLRILGIDPAKRLVEIARKNNIPTLSDYFTPQVAKKIVKNYGQAKIITCTNTFDHVENLDKFMEAISLLLRKDGSLVIEVPYLFAMIQTLNHIFYHQQIDYLMVKPLVAFLAKFEMEITDLETIPLHGGSIRIFIHFKATKKPTKAVFNLIKQEEVLFKNWSKVLKSFAKSVLRQKSNLQRFLKAIKEKNKQIAGIGASAKGITLLNYCNIGMETIDFITEKSPLKIGRFTPSGIPIVSDDHLAIQKPDYLLLLSWNFKMEIIKNLKQYPMQEVKFILPIPKVTII
ncbi:class I SAM-dependent methyltransferase [Candidatus Daviesbacteria bacterium]|nr:class I SAM-dependent methyltransferase [Candidatus Daviesbacteria bacterium]